MPTFTAVVTSHQNPRGLAHMLGILRYQTRPPDEILVYHSETPDVERLIEDFPDCTFIRTENRGDWGHEKRAEGLMRAKGEYLGFFNDDDSYDPAYLERMLAKTDENDAVYCNWNTHKDCSFGMGSSTSGNFIVRSDLAREAGYRERTYEADGHLIEAIRAKTDRITRVDEILYHHNEGVRA